MTVRALIAVVVLVAFLLASACLAGPPPGTGRPTVATPAPAATTDRPAVLILDPAFDGGVTAGNLTVTVRVTGFTLAPPGQPDHPGEGHLVYYRDVTPQTVPGESALTAPGTCAVSSMTAYTWTGVAPGTHTFGVQLVNADDSPLDPPALDAVDVTAVSPGMIVAS